MSDLFSLKLKDALRGLAMAVIGAVLTVLLEMLTQGNLDIKQIALVAITTGISYLIKTYFSDSQNKFLGKI